MSNARKADAANSRRAPRTELEKWLHPENATLPPPPANREDLAYYVRHNLNPTERLVVMLRYAEELGFDEIASVLEMAQTQVEELHNLIVSRIKESLNSCEALAGV